MNSLRTHCIAAFFALFIGALLPEAAHATAYKCKLPNGTTSYQAEPCPTGAKSSTLAAPPPGPVTTSKAESPGARGKAPTDLTSKFLQERDDKRAKEQDDAEKEKGRAAQQAARCNQALRQLDIAKSPLPIYSLNKKAEREYVEDKNREAVIKEAEKKVAAECG
jgi:Domain of unknown function (DUF4124)